MAKGWSVQESEMLDLVRVRVRNQVSRPVRTLAGERIWNPIRRQVWEPICLPLIGQTRRPALGLAPSYIRNSVPPYPESYTAQQALQAHFAQVPASDAGDANPV